MARTGRFGRTPRSAPSLTSTLVAIAREFQNQRAQNVMDAWQKGGMFEGTKATDDVVLKFWKDKAAGVSQDDPLYDTYKNAGDQLDYSIHESKMTAKYALKKATDGQMVAFYLNWAKKVPKDSEFYRVLQRDAGQYMRTQRAAAQVNTRQLAEDRYQRQQSGTQKQKEAGGEFIIETFRRIAQSGNVQAGLGPLIAAPGSGSDLTQFDTEDPEMMLKLISLIAPQGVSVSGTLTISGDGKFKGNDEPLYYDDDKRPVTGTDIMKKIAGFDPSFKPGMPLDVTYVTGMLDRQMQGLNERISRARETGHMSDVSSLQKSKSYVATLNRQVAAYPVQKAYQEARADYDSVISDQGASPQAKLNAWTEYRGTLSSLSNDPRIIADDGTRARLLAEVNGQPGVPTLYESFTGLSDGQFDPSSATDAAKNIANIEFMQSQVDAVKKGAADGSVMWTYGERGSDGTFIPQAGGRMIGAATKESVEAGGLNMQVVTVQDALGGTPLTIAVTATPIYATANDPITGEPLLGTNTQPIGYAYDTPKGSGMQTQYSFTTKDGPIFTSDPLWGDTKSATAQRVGGQNRLVVDYSDEVAKSLGFGDKDPVSGAYRIVPTDLNTTRDLPNGIKVQAGAPKADGTPTGPNIGFDPQDFAWKSGTRGSIGGPDPATDFRSLTLSMLMSDVEGQAVLSNIDKNPAFKNTLDNDAYGYAGFQRDLKTGAWMPGEGADQTKLNAALGQQTMVTTSKSVVSFIQEAAKSWQRTTTGSPAGKSDSTSVFGDVAKLATDLVKGTPFEPLGNIFNSGTNTVKPASSQLVGGVVIKPVSVIKAPVIPPMQVSQAIMGVTPTATNKVVGGPQQTGSQAPGSTGSQPSQTGSAPPSGVGGGGYTNKDRRI